MDPDSDGDGITDGTEKGVTTPLSGTALYKGTDTSATMTSSYRKNFTADTDPSTTTNMSIKDTDGDDLFDGWDDIDGDGLPDSGEAEGEDLDYDGKHDSSESDPNDRDTDDDGVPDSYTINGVQYEGHLDSDSDGKINAIEHDSDNDGLYDGTELGFTENLVTDYTDQDKGYFVEDANPSNTTDPRKADCDGDGIKDGTEDKDHNGRWCQFDCEATNSQDEDGLNF